MIFQLLQSMFSTMVGAWRGPTVDVRAAIIKAQDDNRVSSAPPVRDENPYAGDIHRLEEALGHPLEKGDCIDFKLQDLLRIIPRKRRRIDAYRGLVSKLDKMGVTLTINSQKSKRNDSKFEQR